MKKTLIFLIICFLAGTIHAQSVGIGTDTPDNSALLDIKASNKGILIPRVSTSGRNAISSPAKGLMVYDTTVSRFYYHTGSTWAEIGYTYNGWLLNGNTGAGAGAAIGTNDATNLQFKTNGAKSGAILWGALATTSFGYLAALNPSGSGNAAFGHLALSAITSGYSNTSVGINSLKATNSGYENTGVGSLALGLNTTGRQNTAVGAGALFANTTTSFNTGLGYKTLYNTATSEYNTAVGCYAGSAKNNGYNNVFIGANSDVNGTGGYYNVIVIGQATVGTASSQVTMGNGATGSYRAYANWTNISDGRFKKHVEENVEGLAFINSLRPVTYNLDATGIDQFLHRELPLTDQLTGEAAAIHQQALKEKEQMRVTGFVAQEVEQTARRLGFDFSGIDAPKNENDLYGLRYADFVVPLVKAVQEQQQLIAHQKKSDIDILRAQVELLTKKVERLMAQ